MLDSVLSWDARFDIIRAFDGDQAVKGVMGLNTINTVVALHRNPGKFSQLNQVSGSRKMCAYAVPVYAIQTFPAHSVNSSCAQVTVSHMGTLNRCQLHFNVPFSIVAMHPSCGVMEDRRTLGIRCGHNLADIKLMITRVVVLARWITIGALW